jgi:tyrosine-protein phosphatase SIW14
MNRRTFVLLIAMAPAGAWAASRADEPQGIPNFHQVDDHIYRGAQPTTLGIESLAKLGVKTVIDLRGGEDHSRAEQKRVESAGMKYIHLPLSGHAAPSDGQVGTLLGLLDDSSGWPVFVHCRRGADRTGTILACYRIAHDHWTNDKALKEARLYGMSRLEISMQHYILRFIAPTQAARSPLAVQPAAVP